MKMTFKAQFLKEWTLTDDCIIYGGKTIKLSDIECVTTPFKATRFTNGVISIYVDSKEYNLAYPYKQQAEGEQAAEYIIEYCLAQLDQFADDSEYPDCTSSDIALNEDGNANNLTTVSAADEILKFKELLDMGALTQEEFDAKKKQLLGL